MIEVVQAFDRPPITLVGSDNAAMFKHTAMYYRASHRASAEPSAMYVSADALPTSRRLHNTHLAVTSMRSGHMVPWETGIPRGVPSDST
jgi:hypothetical protein